MSNNKQSNNNSRGAPQLEDSLEDLDFDEPFLDSSDEFQITNITESITNDTSGTVPLDSFSVLVESVSRLALRLFKAGHNSEVLGHMLSIFQIVKEEKDGAPNKKLINAIITEMQILEAAKHTAEEIDMLLQKKGTISLNKFEKVETFLKIKKVKYCVLSLSDFEMLYTSDDSVNDIIQTLLDTKAVSSMEYIDNLAGSAHSILNEMDYDHPFKKDMLLVRPASVPFFLVNASYATLGEAADHLIHRISGSVKIASKPFQAKVIMHASGNRVEFAAMEILNKWCEREDSLYEKVIVVEDEVSVLRGPIARGVAKTYFVSKEGTPGDRYTLVTSQLDCQIIKEEKMGYDDILADRIPIYDEVQREGADDEPSIVIEKVLRPPLLSSPDVLERIVERTLNGNVAKAGTTFLMRGKVSGITVKADLTDNVDIGEKSSGCFFGVAKAGLYASLRSDAIDTKNSYAARVAQRILKKNNFTLIDPLSKHMLITPKRFAPLEKNDYSGLGMIMRESLGEVINLYTTLLNLAVIRSYSDYAVEKYVSEVDKINPVFVWNYKTMFEFCSQSKLLTNSDEGFPVYLKAAVATDSFLSAVMVLRGYLHSMHDPDIRSVCTLRDFNTFDEYASDDDDSGMEDFDVGDFF